MMYSSVLLVWALAADPLAAEAELSAAINEVELKAHVYRLAGKEFLGRKGDGADRAAEHIAAAFARLKLQPAFDGSYFQAIPWLLTTPRADGKTHVGRNVAAVIPGSDPAVADEWIILSAHYDHLGLRGEKMFAGADDNASGVAMLLEVAEAFALADVKPRRTVCFLSCDLEEQNLQGSTHFAAHPPRDLKKLRSFLVADLIGRSLGDVMDEYLFVLGSETAPQLRDLIQRVPGEPGLKTGRLGADIVGTRSDYGPFRDRQVPFLFFTTGTHRDYHRPSDLPERINYEKLACISRWIATVTRTLADAADPPQWAPLDAADMNEVEVLHQFFTRVLDRPVVVPLNEEKRGQVIAARDKLQAIAGRKAITAEERQWLVRTARWALVNVY